MYDLLNNIYNQKKIYFRFSMDYDSDASIFIENVNKCFLITTCKVMTVLFFTNTMVCLLSVFGESTLVINHVSYSQQFGANSLFVLTNTYRSYNGLSTIYLLDLHHHLIRWQAVLKYYNYSNSFRFGYQHEYQDKQLNIVSQTNHIYNIAYLIRLISFLQFVKILVL